MEKGWSTLNYFSSFQARAMGESKLSRCSISGLVGTNSEVVLPKNGWRNSKFAKRSSKLSRCYQVNIKAINSYILWFNIVINQLIILQTQKNYFIGGEDYNFISCTINVSSVNEASDDGFMDRAGNPQDRSANHLSSSEISKFVLEKH